MNISLEEYTVFVAAGIIIIKLSIRNNPGKIIPLKVTEESAKYYGNLVNAIKWWLFIPQAKDLTLNTFAIREVHGPGIVATWRYVILELHGNVMLSTD